MAKIHHPATGPFPRLVLSSRRPRRDEPLPRRAPPRLGAGAGRARAAGGGGGTGPSGRPVAALGGFLLALALLGCASPDDFRHHSDFAVGMSRVEILDRFGPPDDQQVLVKTSPYIWGPIEDFWDRVPLGAKVESWSYRSKARFDPRSSVLTDGSTELYFVDDSDTVNGIGFAVEGAVY